MEREDVKYLLFQTEGVLLLFGCRKVNKSTRFKDACKADVGRKYIIFMLHNSFGNFDIDLIALIKLVTHLNFLKEATRSIFND